MSIIIRLQNLPMSAKSGDVRTFFGGLHIPNGGVHILGGDRGDAFIAFTSSEDARLAMRKDGEKIKDSRIKLYLSSHLEMKYEVEKLTKSTFVDTSTKKLFSSPERSLEEVTRHRSSEKTDRRRYSHSRSPHKSDDWDDKYRNHYHQRINSPDRGRFDSPEVMTSRYRSSSRKRSSSPPRSRSPKSRSVFEREKCVSPELHSYSHQSRDEVHHSDWLRPDSSHNSAIETSKSEIQAALERRITEALEMNPLIFNVKGTVENRESVVVAPDNNQVGPMYFSQRSEPSVPVRDALDNFVQNDLFFKTFSPSLKSDIPQFQDLEFHRILERSPQDITSFVSRHEVYESHELGQKMNNFYITVSGMNPAWDLRKVQIMMKGIYAPLNYIKWERDDARRKTGTAFVKLSNKEDFECMINKATFMYDGHRITVSECPSFLVSKYFPEDSSLQSTYNMPPNSDFCYILKGLPFSCTYDDIVSFFHGYDITDIVIMYDKQGRASGTGYVAFTNWKDFEGAKSQNGKKIGHRYIEMLPCSAKSLTEAKKKNESSVSPFISPLKKLPSSRRPLCALLTGLPFYTNVKKLSAFFTESGLKPDAIHITLNMKRHCDGRAFVEFINFRDFDHALKLHGNKFRDNIICVKQILYDEMTKILDGQKAKHHFEVQEPLEALSDVPEKVPYLWEPPDDAEEQNRLNTGNKSLKLEDCTFEATCSYKSPTTNYGSKRKDQEFDNFRSVDEKGGKNRLSPDKNLLGMNRYHDKNFSAVEVKMEDADFKSRSPEDRGRHSYRERSVERDRKYTREDKHKYNARSEVWTMKPKNERDSRRNNNGRLDSHHRNPEWSDPVGPEESRRFPEDERIDTRDKRYHEDERLDTRDKRYHEDERLDTRECIVQISNVNPTVGTVDVMEFLRGFSFFEDSIIRRYTTEGEPTGDIRVTFLNRREAELAVRALNRNHLGGMRVSMFIV